MFKGNNLHIYGFGNKLCRASSQVREARDLKVYMMITPVIFPSVGVTFILTSSSSNARMVEQKLVKVPLFFGPCLNASTSLERGVHIK